MSIVEKERIYLHPYEQPPGYILQIVRDITEINVRPDGSHYIVTEHGSRYVHNDFVRIYKNVDKKG